MLTDNPLSSGVKDWLTESKRRHMVRPDEENLRIIFNEGCDLETFLMVLAGGVSLSCIQIKELGGATPFICLIAPDKIEVALTSMGIERALYCPPGYVAITFKGDGGTNKLSIASHKVIVLPPQNTTNTVE